MKYLIMCEGPNELQVINILLEHDKLMLGRDDLVTLTPFHARQLRSTAIQTALGLYPGNDIKILRVGDSLNDPLKIPKDMEHRFIGVEKYCTKPELEMLLIFAEGLEAEYDKVKSKEKPKTFAKKNVKCGRKRYDNSSDFYLVYFDGNVDKLVEAIKEYKRAKKHNAGEGFLADLLK